MANTNVNINLVVSDSGDSCNSILDLKDNGATATTPFKKNLTNASKFIDAIAGGVRNFVSGQVEINTPATALLTLTGLPTATETFTLNGTVFTAVASGATGNEFNIGASATATATAIAAAINASTTDGIAKCVTASSLAGVVTITARVGGYSALGYTISESMTNATATAWAIATKTSYANM